MKDIIINGRAIGKDHPPYVVAEISANHGGDLNIALQTIVAAAAAGADAVKIQTYTPDTMTLNMSEGDFMIHGGLWDGYSLYELYQEAHTPYEWHQALFDCARDHGITLFSSPFDETAVDLLQSLQAPAYKIASFELSDLPLIKYAAATGKPLIMSTGMASRENVQLAVEAARSVGNDNILLLHCISSYPALTEEANLNQIVRLRNDFHVQVGLSDHTEDSIAAIASVALGSCFIEKHFILDSRIGGPDSRFSIMPDALQALCSSTYKTWQAMGQGNYHRSVAEEENKAFRRSLYFVKDLQAGDEITPDAIRRIRPGYGLEPRYLDEIIGKKLTRDVQYGSAVRWDYIGPGE